MNEQEIKRIAPNASKDFLQLNRGGESPFDQHGAGDGPLAKKKTKDQNTRRFLVSITSYRAGRPCDPDNLFGKWHLDCLRYAGCLLDDRQEDIDYKISQKKVATKKEEKTLIEVTEL